jgi:hypothetical protein
MQKRITKDNLKYASQQKSNTEINKVLKISLNALDRGDEMAMGGETFDSKVKSIKSSHYLI